MIRPRKKLIIGTVLMLVLVLILWSIMLLYSTLNGMGYYQFRFNKSEEDNKYQGIVDTVRGLEGQYKNAYDHFYSRIQVKADLAAKALYQSVSNEGDASIKKEGKGCVVKIENGEMTAPSGTRSGLREYTDKITENRGTMIYQTPTMNGVRKDILVYSHIKGPYYYMEIVNGQELFSYVRDYIKLEDILFSMQFAYNVVLDIYCPDHENSRFFFCYPSDFIFESNMLDINDPSVSKLLGLAADAEQPDTGQERPGDVVMQANSEAQMILTYAAVDIEELGCKLILGFPEAGSFLQSIEETSVGFLVIITLCIVFIVFITSVFKEVLCGVVTREKKEKYSPAKVRIIAVSYGIVSILAVFGTCMFMRSLSNLYKETETLDSTAGSLNFRLQEWEWMKEQEDKDRKALHFEYAKRLAELIERYPHLNEKENLKELSEIIGARYIMLYDSSGKETSTSSEYINMELGALDANPQLSTADFRRILNGVPGIAHNAFRDEVTGRTLELIGVRTNDPESGGYGVLIAAMDPVDQGQTEKEETDSILKSITPNGKISLIVDPKSKWINYSSDTEVYGPAEYEGIKDSMLHDGVSDFTVINGKRYFIVSEADNDTGYIHYFCTPTDMIFGKGLGYALICAIGFGIIFAILCIYLLKGYTDAAVEEAEQRGPEAPEEEKNAGGILSKVKAFFNRMTGTSPPETKAMMTLRVLLALAMLNLLLEYFRRGENGQGAFVLDYILGGKWSRGINMFAITAMVILFCGLAVGMFFVRFVLGMIGNMMGSRGQTICRLIANMIGYLSILVFFYYALSYLGVDTNAILASVGVMGLGLTMGARDLISDILAGISLIFDGEYQVGDIVSIDGYRGMVQEVGVRTTKIIGRGGNIKILRNMDVKNVINHTMLNSWVPITIKVDVNYPLRDVEAILAETLPRVGNTCKEIISGPYYKGVLSVEIGFAVLSIIAECNEEDYHYVERTLMREVLLALREKNVPVR